MIGSSVDRLIVGYPALHVHVVRSTTLQPWRTWKEITGSVQVSDVETFFEFFLPMGSQQHQGLGMLDADITYENLL